MSHKVRVHELAKKYEKNSKDVIDALSKIGIELQSHLSGIEAKDIDKATTYLDQKFLLNKKESPEIKEVKEIKEIKKPSTQAGTLRKKVHEAPAEVKKEEVAFVQKNEETAKENVFPINNEKRSFTERRFDRPYERREDRPQQNFNRENSQPYRTNRFENKDRESGEGSRNDRFENRDRGSNEGFRTNRFENRDRGSSEGFISNRFENKDRNANEGFRTNRFENKDRNSNEGFRTNRFENKDRGSSEGFRTNRFENRDRNANEGFRTNRFENKDRGSSEGFKNRNFDRPYSKPTTGNFNRSNENRPSFPFKRDGYKNPDENKFGDKDRDPSRPFFNKRPPFVKKDESAPLPLEIGKVDRKKHSDKNKPKKYEDKPEKGFAKKKSIFDELGGSSSARKAHKKKKREVAQQKEEAAKNLLKEERIITLGEDITLKLLAEKIGINPTEIVKYLFLKGHVFTLNSLIPFDLVEEIALQYNVLVAKEEKREKYIQKIDQTNDTNLEERAPIVTIIGHVDHGKTSLLDAIRKSTITAGEAGGITQKIGAYQVDKNGKKITFIDTPGHEAFSDMRARGTSITDIAILVVAADDGIMPQTVEAISHAKYAKVPIVVAINKIDKPEANIERVKQQLADHELLAREWGGDTEIVEISAAKNINLDKLLDTLVVLSEILELKADQNKLAKAIVLESRLDPKIGPVADLIVKDGTLKKGDVFIVSNSMGKVRAMINENGQKLEKASPSSPVEIFGLTKVPETGDLLEVVENEKVARKLISEREIKDEYSIIYTNAPIHETEGLKDYKLILKTGSKGSLEAVKSSILKIQHEEVKISLIYSATGPVNEGDVKLAHASKAKIITFEVAVSPKARKDAEEKKIEIKSYNIIYKLIEDLEDEVKNMSSPKFREAYQGRIEIKRIFKVSKVGTIGGSIVVDGKITKTAKIKLFRNSKEIFEGKISSLKRFNNDANTVEVGQECGISLENYNDIKEGDILEAYISEQI